MQQNPVNTQIPNQQPAYAPMPPAQPVKKKKTGCLIAVIVAVVVLVLTIVLVAVGIKKASDKIIEDVSNEFDIERMLEDTDEYDEETEPETETTTEEVKTNGTGYFEKGSIEEGIYANSWADLRFKLGKKWTDNIAEGQESFSGDQVHCDLYAESDSAMMYILLLDLSSEEYQTNEEFLASYFGGFKKSLDDAKMGEVVDYKIANRTYSITDITYSANGNSGCSTVAVCKTEGRVILINVSGTDAESNRAILDQFKQY